MRPRLEQSVRIAAGRPSQPLSDEVHKVTPWHEATEDIGCPHPSSAILTFGKDRDERECKVKRVRICPRKGVAYQSFLGTRISRGDPRSGQLDS